MNPKKLRIKQLLTAYNCTKAHPEAKALLREYDQREAAITDLLKQLAAL